MAAALRMRRSAGLRLDEAICVYDLAEHLGIEVRFAEIPSLEGMYCPELGPTIILSSLRPSGRRAYTCAHELGHHSKGDGTQIDQLTDKPTRSRLDTTEFAAECFAGALLMPKMAVQRAFTIRGWNIEESTPDQIYIIANYFGVGYSTLVHHMRSGLRLLHERHAAMLFKITNAQARAQAFSWQSPEPVCIVDYHWKGRPIDVEVGDLLLVQGRPAFDGYNLTHLEDTRRGLLFRAQQPGLSKLSVDRGWSAFVRVSRRNFIGRSTFRHLREGDDEGSNDH